MDRGILADPAHDFEYPEPSRLSLAYRGKNQGSKKTAETNAIFANVRQINALADADSGTLRISIDTKATLSVGEYSRGGQSRGLLAVKALDHDLCLKEKLVPGGILEPVSGRSFLFFGTNYKTSDFLVDGFLLWWEERKQALFGVKQLVINLDNGPECSGHRSQFLCRMAAFADKTGLCIRLVYYPPYHSKYNAIERYWAGLEKSWNGYLLSSVNTVLRRAANFFWKDMRTVVQLLDTVYKKGVKVCGDEKVQLEQRLQRSSSLQWWDITIHPKLGDL
jgi:Rhodopirellula transposase DDE domain